MPSASIVEGESYKWCEVCQVEGTSDDARNRKRNTASSEWWSMQAGRRTEHRNVVMRGYSSLRTPPSGRTYFVGSG